LPKMTGRMDDEFLGKLHFALYFVGFNLLYFPMFGAWETPRRVFHYDVGLQWWHQLATIGGFLLGASFLVMFYNLFKSMAVGEEVGDNPWEYASSAEWAVSSPPPLENFEGIPSYVGGKLSFRDEGGAATDGGSTADGAGDGDPVADGGDPAADGGTQPTADAASGGPTAEAAPASGSTPDVSTTAAGETASAGTGLATPEPAGESAPVAHETGHEEHADHASFYPFIVSFAAFLAFLGLSGIDQGGIYYALAAGGGLLSAYGFVGMAQESFYVPEPDAALTEQWPFAGVENMKLGMWTFLGSDVVLFGGFIGSYLFLRVANGWQDWHHLIPEDHVVLPGLINTYLLLASSFAIVLALVASHRNSAKGVVASLVVTLALGIGFLINKAIEWLHLFHVHTDAFPEGWEISTNVASSTFYLTTGLHGAHVTVGLLMLVYMIPRAWNGAYLDEDERWLEYFGLYWHFVDIVWLFLFPLFYIL
jgi:cytochrome c oxidase subunit I+III